MRAPEPQPLKGVLALRRISQAALARELNVSRTYLGKIVNGWWRPSRRVAVAIAELLGEPVEDLFRREDLDSTSSYPGDELLVGGRR